MRKIKIILLITTLFMILAIFAGCSSPLTEKKTSEKDITVTTEAPSDKQTEETIETADATTDITTDEIPTEEPTSEKTTEELTTGKETTEKATEESTEEITTEEETTVEPAEETTETITTEAEYALNYEIYKSDIVDIMQNIFEGDKVMNETVMFLDYGDVKPLLFYADSIVSVTSYDGLDSYTEGVDYKLEDGKLVLLEGSRIPCITREVYYNNTSSDFLKTKYDGNICSTYWGEGRTMTQWQVNVTYTHSDSWNGFKQECFIETYEEFLDKLCSGEDVTVLFYGDSITRGANSSLYIGHDPYQPDYTKLFVYALADLFDYSVKHVRTGLNKTFDEQVNTYNREAERGTITYINSAVGGWDCAAGNNYAQEYVVEIAEIYGCDLFVLNFGMNNGGTDPKTFQTYTKKTVSQILKVVPDTSIMLVSSMVSNPQDVNSSKNQILFEDPLEATAQGYTREGIPCALVRMASISDSVLDHKDFNDYSANNVNHPNDFFMRVYAQTLLQALIGYENMK